MTGEQPLLEDAIAAAAPTTVRSKLTPAEQWRLAVRDNPHLPGAVVDCVRQLRAQGRRVSMNRVWEELRERVHTVGDECQLNNTWRAPAADWLRQVDPDLAEGIETRRRRR